MVDVEKPLVVNKAAVAFFRLAGVMGVLWYARIDKCIKQLSKACARATLLKHDCLFFHPLY